MTTTTKLRKNANKKINAFIAAAEYITIETMSSDMSDCFNSNGHVEINAERVNEFMESNYNDLVVMLHADDNGVTTSMTIKDGIYYFCDEITVHLTAKPLPAIEVKEVEQAPKFKMTYAAVKGFLKAGFVSPLNHGATTQESNEDEDKDKIITKIEVLWSESSVFNSALCQDENFNINQVVTMETYARLAWLELADQKRYKAKTGESSGYSKTKVKLTLKSGQVCTYRHDISLSEATLSGCWSDWVDYCNAESVKRTATH